MRMFKLVTSYLNCWTSLKLLPAWKNRRDTPFNFSGPVNPICALGVFFSYDSTKAAKLNIDEKLRSMEKILSEAK